MISTAGHEARCKVYKASVHTMLCLQSTEHEHISIAKACSLAMSNSNAISIGDVPQLAESKFLAHVLSLAPLLQSADAAYGYDCDLGDVSQFADDEAMSNSDPISIP